MDPIIFLYIHVHVSRNGEYTLTVDYFKNLQVGVYSYYLIHFHQQQCFHFIFFTLLMFRSHNYQKLNN